MSETETPGIYVYESFDFNFEGGVFMTAVVAEIDSVQYFRDRPLLLKEIQPVLAPAINTVNNPDELLSLIGDQDAQEYLNNLKQIGPQQDIFLNSVADILEEIAQKSNIQLPDEASNLTRPPTQQKPPIRIFGSSGEVISEISPESLDTGFSKTAATDSVIVALTEEEFQDNVEEAVEDINELLNEIPTSNNVDDTLVDASADINDDMPPIDEQPQPDLNELTESELVWYGIPLINLGPKDATTRDSYIVQINTKHNWNLDITGIITTGLEKDQLRIPITIPPDTKFLAGVYQFKNSITIFLKIDGDDHLYQKSVTLQEIPKFEVVSYGIDNDKLKTLCGYLWDIYFWQSPEPFNVNLPGILPEYPKHDTVFDFNSGRINGQEIYPSGNYGTPAYNGGEWTLLPADWDLYKEIDDTESPIIPTDSWQFIKDGYLNRLFCRNGIKNSDFSIIWCSWIENFPNEINTLVSDDLQSNYVQYDFRVGKLILNFNGRTKEEYITLPEKIWALYSLRYKKETGELTFSFIDFFGDIQEEVTMDIGNDLYFELMSLWGRFDSKANDFIEIFKAISGYLIISRNYKEIEELESIYFNAKSIFKKYNVSRILNA